MLKQHPREERRWVTENCCWCIPHQKEIYDGTIVNESATGIFMQSESIPAIGTEVCVLSIPGEDALLESLTAEDIAQHPLTRTGIVKRNEMNKRVGIHFSEENDGRMKYRRWFRGDATVVTLMDSTRCVIHLSGKLSLEAASFVQKHITKFRSSVSEFIITCHQLTGSLSSAATILRTAIVNADKLGLFIIVLSKDTSTQAALITKNLELKNGVYHSLDDVSIPGSVSSPKPVAKPVVESEPIDTPSAKPKSPAKVQPSPAEKPKARIFDIDDDENGVREEGEYGSKIVVVCQNTNGLARLVRPLERVGIGVVTSDSFEEAVDKIVTNRPPIVIADVDIEACESVLILDGIYERAISPEPVLILAGPKHLSALFKKALDFPIHAYLSKPYTERDFKSALESLVFKHQELLLSKR